MPHPLQRQRYHLLDRDPQWHNVFLSKKKPTRALWQPRARVPKKIRFLLARNKVTTHLQSCWWSLPENACHLQHKDTCQWSLSHSEIYQPILSIVIIPVINLLFGVHYSLLFLRHYCITESLRSSAISSRDFMGLCPQSQRFEAAFEKKKRVGADPSHSSTSDNNPRIKGDGGPSAFTAAKNWDFTAVGEASSIQRP